MAPENMTSNEDEMEIGSEADLEAMASPEELARMEEEEAKAQVQKEELLVDLANKIESKFKDRAQNRGVKERQWIEATNLYYGGLSNAVADRSPDRPFSVSSNKRRPDFNIVQAKCDIAISQCVSMQFSAGEKNWDLFPAANESDPVNVDKCELMSAEIETQLDECNYGYQCRLAMADRVILGTGILKGPVNTGELCRQYAQDSSGAWLPKVDVKYKPNVVRVNPWFFYPDDSTNDFAQCQDSIEIHPKSPLELSKLRDHEGFRKDAIERVLKVKPADYINSNFTEYTRLTDTNPYLFRNKYCIYEYHGPITLTELQELDIEPSYDSPTEEYYGEVWVCQGEVIRIELENIEGSFEIPYAASTWKKDPASVFGFGSPLTMRDAQRVVTQSWHMLLDNASLSSAPQYAIQKRYIQPVDGTWELGPGKGWYLTDPMAKVGDAIQFFNVPNVEGNLTPILSLARQFAEEESNTPLISAGMGSPDNVDSATGQLIMKQSSTVLLDFLAEEWDDQITQKVISRMYSWNMQYNEKDEIKGNYVIDVRSSTEYKNKQMYIRDVERVSVEMGQNPEMAKFIKPDELTKMRLNMMHLPSRTLFRTPDEVAQYEQQQAQAAQNSPDMIEMQLKQKEVEQKDIELKLKAAELQANKTIEQQRAQWEHEEKMAANYARTVEAQAMVLRSQNEKEAELIKLAAHSDDQNRKHQVMQNIATQNSETAIFLKSMDADKSLREALLKDATKREENALYGKEIDLAKNKGKGV